VPARKSTDSRGGGCPEAPPGWPAADPRNGGRGSGLDSRSGPCWHGEVRPGAALTILALSLALAAPAARARAEAIPRYLNLDFESPGYPRDWYTGSEGYSVDLDSTAAFSGRQCLRIRYLHPGRVGIASQQFPPALAAGHRLRIEAAVRTESVGTGWAGLWCRVDGRDRMLAYVTSREDALHGTTPWSERRIEVDVDSTVTAVTFGGILAGDGVAWFDRFRLYLDGQPYEEPPAPPIVDPDSTQMAWLRAHAVPIATDDPERSDDDLIPLMQMVGSAHVVGLGEGTHGTREFLRMKHRMVRALAENLGFNLFALESNLPETASLNHYVLTGEGDPRELLRAMHFWTWNTEEMLAFVRWMRAYNASGRGPIRFLGFDMQDPVAAIDSLLGFVGAADPAYLPALRESLDVIAGAREAERQGPAGTALGILRAQPFAGKRVRFSGWIRTEDVEDGEAALWLRADGGPNRPVTDGMEGRGPRGTTRFARYEVEIRVPRGAKRLFFGAVLRGDGVAWFDSLDLAVEGLPTRSGPGFDFDFERPLRLGGLRVAGPGYSFGLDSAVAAFGRRSLRIREDPMVVNRVWSARWARAVGAAAAVLAHVRAESLTVAATQPARDVGRAVENARLTLQACRARANPPTRDASMAENVEWLLSRAPVGSKIVLWAHNAHVSRREGAMGHYLAERYGTDYVSFATAFHEGSYVASERSGLVPVPAMPSQPGSLEWALHRTGLPRLALDLREASPDDSASAWLLGGIDFRNIGAIPVQHGFYRTQVAHDFDAVIFFDRTTPSRPLSGSGRP
jgi:erythromycin esterase-like protein